MKIKLDAIDDDDGADFVVVETCERIPGEEWATITLHAENGAAWSVSVSFAEVQRAGAALSAGMRR